MNANSKLVLVILSAFLLPGCSCDRRPNDVQSIRSGFTYRKSHFDKLLFEARQANYDSSATGFREAKSAIINALQPGLHVIGVEISGKELSVIVVFSNGNFDDQRVYRIVHQDGNSANSVTGIRGEGLADGWSFY